VERLDLGEHHRVGGSVGKRRVVEAVDVGAGEQPVGVQPDGGGELAGGRRLSPVTRRTETSWPASRRMAWAAPGLGGSRKASRPRSVMPVSSAALARWVVASGQLAMASTR